MCNMACGAENAVTWLEGWPGPSLTNETHVALGPGYSVVLVAQLVRAPAL